MQSVRLVLLQCFLVILATPAYSADPPSRFKVLSSKTYLERDGTATQIFHYEIAVSTDAAARQQAQQNITFNDEVERVVLVSAATIKPDGRQLAVPETSIRTQGAPGTQGVPQFSNRKQIVAIFPDVAGGDVLSLTWQKTVTNPIIPGHFTHSSWFIRTLPWDEAEVLISLPADMDLQTEEFGPTHSRAEEDGRTVHRWRYSAPGVAIDPAVLLPIDRVPRLFASTFADWSAFSRAYAALIAPKMAITAAVQARADEIAAGTPDKREEARLISEWVSRRIRWVALYVENGAFIPHSADEVLTNGFGDCKDQVMLLTALLQARGITAEPVLINLFNSYRLSGPATLSGFNHMIAYLPAYAVYVDPTAGGAVFGQIQAQEYGKPILHITPEGSPPSRIPPLAVGEASASLITRAKLEVDGRITGDSVTEATGPYATVLRGVANRILVAGSEAAASQQLTALGTLGSGNVAPDALDPIQRSYSISSSFTLNAHSGILEGDGFTLPVGLRLTDRVGDGLIGSLKAGNLPSIEPTPCWAGVQTEELTLQIPPGLRPARLPHPRKIEGEAFTYESRWSFDAGVVRAVRRMESRVDQPLCEGPLREAAAKALEQIRRDHSQRIELEATQKE